MLLWLMTTSLGGAQECPDVNDVLEDLQAQVVEIRLEAARTTLDSLESSFSCGPPFTSDLLAQLWTLEAMVEMFSGNQEAAEEPLAAALRMNPKLLVSDYGSGAESTLETIKGRERGTGTLDLTGVPEPAQVWIDGQRSTSGSTLEEGLHLLQITDENPDAKFGRLIFIANGEVVTLPIPELQWDDASPQASSSTAQSPKQPVSVAPDVPPKTSQLWFALGAQGGAGTAQNGLDSTGTMREEPALKVGFPIELGVLLRGSDTPWIRVTATGTPLLGGDYLFQMSDGVGAWPLTVGATFAAGLRQGPVDFGLGSGIALPGRIPIFGLARIPLGDSPIGIEGRIGTNLVTGRPTEPTGALLFHWAGATSASK